MAYSNGEILEQVSADYGHGLLLESQITISHSDRPYHYLDTNGNGWSEDYLDRNFVRVDSYKWYLAAMARHIMSADWSMSIYEYTNGSDEIYFNQLESDLAKLRNR